MNNDALMFLIKASLKGEWNADEFFFMDLLNNCEIKLGEQINPCSELDQWLRKLTFQHKARGWEGGIGVKHRHPCRLLRSNDYHGWIATALV